MDDRRLVERIRQGDESAFAELFERHRLSVFRYARHMGGGRDAEDVVQDVFLAFLRQLAGYDASRGPILAYLLGIARRLVLKGRADAGRTEAYDESTMDAATHVASSDGDPFDDVDQMERVDRVRAAIAALPPFYREVIVLCELNELDYATAAAVMNCPIGTVRSRLHRARSMLTTRLSRMRERMVTIDGR